MGSWSTQFGVSEIQVCNPEVGTLGNCGIDDIATTNTSQLRNACLKISFWSKLFFLPITVVLRVALCPIISLAPWLVWLCRRSHVFWQLESPFLRPFESIHLSLLCAPADSFLHGSVVSLLLYRTDDSFQGGMKNILALKLFTPIFTVDKLGCHSGLTIKGKKGI